ncbi:MAG: helix-turn-helix domain-containing protein [Bacteroidales bacterium]|nr:helix-turn-helix domain-containing protein [Bacteroidales bacterium]
MKYKKHSFEEKLHCMKLLDQGYPLRKLSREIGIMRNQLRALRKRYLAFGEDGLRRKPSRYPTEAEMV